MYHGPIFSSFSSKKRVPGPGEQIGVGKRERGLRALSLFPGHPFLPRPGEVR